MEENWDKLKSELDKKNNDITFGKPVLIESYISNVGSKTYLFVTKIVKDEEDFIILMTMNTVLVKERLIWMAYYSRYTGEDSVELIKTKNDKAVSLLLDVNK